MRRISAILMLGAFAVYGVSCVHEPDVPPGTAAFDPTPMTVEALDMPLGLPPFPADVLSTMTVEGVDLGRHLFFDPGLSADSTLSCAGCHHINAGTIDEGNAFSVGIDGISGTRNSMPIFNLAYSPDYEVTFEGVPIGGFFWDSRAETLKEQVLMPIEDPIEMHNTLGDAIAHVNRMAVYRGKFWDAFGDSTATPERMADALTQYLHSIVSGGSHVDLALTPGSGVFWEEEALEGYELFGALEPLGADCIHCHTSSGLFTAFEIRNNALLPYTRKEQFVDRGLGAVTGDTLDYGKFKVPSLRNIALTPPYMHDGRFASLRDVLEHYNEGLHLTPFTDPLMKYSDQGGMQFGDEELDQLEAFLNALTDESLATKPQYQNPWPE